MDSVRVELIVRCLAPKNVEAVCQLPRNGGGQTNGQHKRSDTQNHTKHGEDIAPHPVHGSVPGFFEGGERPRCTTTAPAA